MEFIRTEDDVAKALVVSESQPIFIYKHSPICGLSDIAILEWERFLSEASERCRYYQVDVIAARPASRKIESLTQIRHESPQVLMISRSICIWHASHRGIKAEKIKSQTEEFCRFFTG